MATDALLTHLFEVCYLTIKCNSLKMWDLCREKIYRIAWDYGLHTFIHTLFNGGSARL